MSEVVVLTLKSEVVCKSEKKKKKIQVECVRFKESVNKIVYIVC